MSERGARRWRLVRATPAAIPASVRRFNRRARQRRLRSARPWFIAAAAVATIGIATWLVYGSALLGVRQVQVVGAGYIPVADIQAAARVPIGTPLASVDTGVVAGRVRGLIEVANARVRRDWPSTLVIDVTPRVAVAASPSDQGYLLLDAGGVPFRTVSGPGDLPIVVLASPGPDDESTQGALSVLASLPTELRDQLVRIEAPAPTRIRLVLPGGRTIIWGDATDNVTKGRVAVSLLQHPGKVIDVSAPNVVTVR